jgi:hypothetical protein
MNRSLAIPLLLAVCGVALAGALAWTTRPTPARAPQPDITAYTRSVMANCAAAKLRGACLKNVASDLLDRYALSDILRVFDENETQPEFFDRCHETAHYLGQEAFRRIGSIPEVYAQASRACLGGTYHGAVEGYLMEKRIKADDYDAVHEEIPKICGTPADYRVHQEFTECAHGLGHATMYFTENDLPLALALCDAGKNMEEREICYTGAFMANWDSLGSEDHPTKYAKLDDPLFPCPILEERYQRQCYTYGILTTSQGSVERSAELCRMIPERYRTECFATIGRDRTMTTADPAELRQQCGIIAEERYRLVCLNDAAYNLVVRFGPASDIPFAFCDTAPADEKTACYDRISSAVPNLVSDADERRAFCARMPEPYQAACLRRMQ